jgi:hypothetical protein
MYGFEASYPGNLTSEDQEWQRDQRSETGDNEHEIEHAQDLTRTSSAAAGGSGSCRGFER